MHENIRAFFYKNNDAHQYLSLSGVHNFVVNKNFFVHKNDAHIVSTFACFRIYIFIRRDYNNNFCIYIYTSRL